MISATTNGFTVSASNEYNSDYAAWKACDASYMTAWAMLGNTFPSWWQVQCPSPVIVSYIQISKRCHHDEFINDFIFQGSNDGITWVDIASSIGELPGIGEYPNVLTVNINDPTNTAYTYYRVYCKSGFGPNPGFSIFQMYGKVQTMTPSTIMVDGGVMVNHSTISPTVQLASDLPVTATADLIAEAISVIANSGNTNPTADDIENAINAAINIVANATPQ
jgi:hypothetical protein